MIRLIFVIALVTACVTASTGREAYFKVTVRKGDTPASIAQRFDTSWAKIRKQNQLEETSRLYAGQVLKITPGPAGWPADAVKPRQEKGIESKNGDSGNEGLLFNSTARGSFIWPAKGAISSGFGPRGGRLHEGIDIKAYRGSPIQAADSGIVTFAGWKSGYGNTVIIRHPSSNYSTLYAHCLRIKVQRGQRISRGKVVATVGRSGRATGYHLHFEIRGPRNRPKDPLAFLDHRDNILSAL